MTTQFLHPDDPGFHDEPDWAGPWKGKYPEGKGPIRRDPRTGKKRRAIKREIRHQLTGNETADDWNDLFQYVSRWCWYHFQNDHGGDPEHQLIVNFLELTKRMIMSGVVVMDVEDVPMRDTDDLLQMQKEVAAISVEDITDGDLLTQAWLNADDHQGRIRQRLKDLKYWWEA